jgi:hypothetical protein
MTYDLTGIPAAGPTETSPLIGLSDLKETRA